MTTAERFQKALGAGHRRMQNPIQEPRSRTPSRPPHPSPNDRPPPRTPNHQFPPEGAAARASCGERAGARLRERAGRRTIRSGRCA